MVLKLNSSNEGKTYAKFYGQNIKQMPKLVSAHRTALSINDFHMRRLKLFYSIDEELRGSWIYNYFDTSDAVFYHPDGRVKFVPNAQVLREMTPNSKRLCGALVLEDGVYESTNGWELKVAELKKMNIGKPLTPKEAKANQILLFHFNVDREALSQYVDVFLPEMKRRWGYDRAMGVYLDSSSKVPKAKSLVLCGSYGRSLIDGRYPLDGNDGCLVGKLAEKRAA